VSFPFGLGYAALWALVLFQTLVLLGLLRGMPGGRLPLGTLAPDFSAVEAHSGRTMRLAELAGRRSILLFLSPGCRNCANLAAAIHGIYHKAEGRLVLVCQGSRQECVAFLATHDPGRRLPLLLDPELVISFQFRIAGAPAAVLLDDELRIRSYGSPQRSEELEEIVAEAVGGTVADPAAAVAGGSGR
jgi:hypothetical protein